MGTGATGSAGSLLAGRYRLVEPLPGAGSGWRARDDLGNREVAARRLVAAEAPEPLRRRAAREAREAARLRHPAIVPVLDVVEHEDALWSVTQLVPAVSLDELLGHRGPVPPVDAARIGLRVLVAVEAADAAGVRHRDLTPASVLVADDGRVWVTGFGQTPEPEQVAGQATLVTGSVEFLAPERVRGITAGGLPADLWSLGATLYTAVEGRLPFHREAPLATLAAVVTDEPPPPRRAGALRAVIDGLLIKDPAHRLGVAEARQMLDAVGRGAPVVPVPRRTAGQVGPDAAGTDGPAPPASVSAPPGEAETRSAGTGTAAAATSAGAGDAGPAGAGDTTDGSAAGAGPGEAGGNGVVGLADSQATEVAVPRGADAGAPREGGAGAGERPDNEIHDPEIAAALAAFEAALAPVV
ncbi:MAG TPA: serine/threonine-protein kinase, partial [Mycobacteriales bacterium]|nr:serine/threonine-protein kinase [Mycobacteriales bacterium]